MVPAAFSANRAAHHRRRHRLPRRQLAAALRPLHGVGKLAVQAQARRAVNGLPHQRRRQAGIQTRESVVFHNRRQRGAQPRPRCAARRALRHHLQPRLGHVHRRDAEGRAAKAQEGEQGSEALAVAAAASTGRTNETEAARTLLTALPPTRHTQTAEEPWQRRHLKVSWEPTSLHVDATCDARAQQCHAVPHVGRASPDVAVAALESRVATRRTQ